MCRRLMLRLLPVLRYLTISCPSLSIENILKQMKKNGISVTEISPNNLSMDNIMEMLNDFLGSPSSNSNMQELASTLLSMPSSWLKQLMRIENTGGNPFDCWHVILTQSPLLLNEKEKRKDREEEVSMEVNFLRPLQFLGSSTAQRLVFLASCLNCYFGVDTLLLIKNKIAHDQSVFPRVSSSHFTRKRCLPVVTLLRSIKSLACASTISFS